MSSTISSEARYMTKAEARYMTKLEAHIYSSAFKTGSEARISDLQATVGASNLQSGLLISGAHIPYLFLFLIHICSYNFKYEYFTTVTKDYQGQT